MSYKCDLCGKIEEKLAFNKSLHIKEDSFDMCNECISKKRRVNIFRQEMELTNNYSCDNCNRAICGRCTVINATFIFCADCLSINLTLEEMNESVNTIIYKLIAAER